MNRQIPLKDVFNNICEYVYCEHNHDESCDYGYHISEYMTYRDRESFATCNRFQVKEGYCEDCGAQLTEHIDMLPYGDTHVAYRYYECKGC